MTLDSTYHSGPQGSMVIGLKRWLQNPNWLQKLSQILYICILARVKALTNNLTLLPGEDSGPGSEQRIRRKRCVSNELTHKNAHKYNYMHPIARVKALTNKFTLPAGEDSGPGSEQRIRRKRCVSNEHGRHARLHTTRVSLPAARRATLLRQGNHSYIKINK